MTKQRRTASLLFSIVLCCIYCLVSSSNPSNDILDVAVIGSGPGGLSCAKALSTRLGGCKVAIFERARAFRPIGAALGLNTLGYDSLQKLDMNLAEIVRSRGANPRWHLLQRPCGEKLYTAESMMSETDFTWLGWYSLQTALRESLPEELPVHLQHRLVDFKEDSENGLVELHFQVGDKDEIKKIYTRVLVGADGYQSAVREQTVDDGAPNYTGTMTWRGVLKRDQFPDGKLGWPFHTDEEFGNISIVGDSKNFWIMDCGCGEIAWTGTAPQENNEKSESPLETALRVFEGWPPIVETLIRTTDPDAIVESAVLDRAPVASWGVYGEEGKFKRVTLLGDAAHPMRPSLGLGSTMAFQDSLRLSEKLAGVDLANTEAVAKAIGSYEKLGIEATAPLHARAQEQGQKSHAPDQADRMLSMLKTHLAAKTKHAESSFLGKA